MSKKKGVQRKIVTTTLGVCATVLIGMGMLGGSETASANAVNDYIKQGVSQKGWKAPGEQNQLGDIPITSGYRNGVGRPQGVAVHETANPNSNIAGEIAYMKRNYQNAFVHEFVDANNIIGIADTDYVSWGAGPAGNSRFVQTEQVRMHNKDDFAKELLNLATFKANVLKQYGLTPSMGNASGGGTVWTHAMITRYLGGTDHMDPDQYWADSARQWYGSTYTINDFYNLLNDVYYNRMAPSTPANVNANTTVRQEGGNFVVDVTVSGDTSRITNVDIATWGAVNGQNDLKWYGAQKINANTYRYTIPVSNHREKGLYHLHTYIRTNDGQYKGKAVNTINYQEANTPLDLSINVNGKQATIKAVIKNDAGRVNKVLFPTWGNANQSDIKWYEAKKVNANTWEYTVDLTKHGNFNTYNVHTYVETDNWNRKGVSANQIKLSEPTVSAYTTVDVSGKIATVRTKLSGEYNRVRGVEFPTWASNNGQKDLVWYKGEKVSADTWEYKVDLSKHKIYGSYDVHTYLEYDNGMRKSKVGNKFNYAQPMVDADVRVSVNSSTNIATITGKFTGDSERITQVLFPVWQVENNQNDIKWYEGTKVTNDTWTATVDLNKHFGKDVYNIHTYVYFDGWDRKIQAWDTFNCEEPVVTPPTTEGNGGNEEGQKPVEEKITVADSVAKDYLVTISEPKGDTVLYKGNPPITQNGGAESGKVADRKGKTFRVLRESRLSNGKVYVYGLFGDKEYFWIEKGNTENERKTPQLIASFPNYEGWKTLKDDAKLYTEDVMFREPAELKDASEVKKSNSAGSLSVTVKKKRQFDNGEIWHEVYQNGKSLGWVIDKDLK